MTSFLIVTLNGLTLASIALSIIMADLMLWYWGGITYQVTLPDALADGHRLPLLGVGYATIRLVLIGFALAVGLGLWFIIAKTKLGSIIRAGVDDRDMLRALPTDITIVLIKQNIHAALAAAQNVAIMVNGVIVEALPAAVLESGPDLQKRHLGIESGQTNTEGDVL